MFGVSYFCVPISMLLYKWGGTGRMDGSTDLRVHECVRHSPELYCSQLTYMGVTLSLPG